MIGIFVFVIGSLAQAQESSQKYWIYFTSKEQISFSKSAPPAEIAAVTGISERALQRRAKMSSAIITAEDLPVQPSFLYQLKERGIAIQNTSRWFNAATAYLTSLGGTGGNVQTQRRSADRIRSTRFRQTSSE
jgi:hypothetical protein